MVVWNASFGQEIRNLNRKSSAFVAKVFNNNNLIAFVFVYIGLAWNFVLIKQVNATTGDFIWVNPIAPDGIEDTASASMFTYFELNATF